MSEQWTDERIIAEAESVVADYQTDHRMRQHIIATMMQVRNDTQAEIDALRNACMNEDHAISQILGKALGYPRYCDDPKNFPDAIEADGVCVGDQVTATLAQEVADRIQAQASQIETLQHQLAQLAELAIRPGEWKPVREGNIDDLTYIVRGVLCAETELGTFRLELPGGWAICRLVESK